ncbi:MAG: PEP-CTERM sorting domain-containing protein [Verrucomicrobiota bacterium]|nr:PEP-CTERM sorting domain-containing protein [Verrucomicrobiota bacterium]
MTQQNSLVKRGGLAGALAIAGGTAAYGAPVLVNPPPDLTNTIGNAVTTTVNWDVNNDGIIDFTFTNRYPNSSTTGVVWQLNMNPAAGTAATNGVVSYQGAFVRYAFALAANTPINSASAFSTGTQITLGSRYSSGGVQQNYGGFAAAIPPGTMAFAGFRFTAADGVHYGWVQLSVNAGIIRFSRAGYETTPGVPILAGTGAAVPEPSTLAMLAVGAVGVVGAAIKRRRRS